MIWIATLCLLIVAAWLFFNGLNEKRWVEAHSHDETVAADDGLFPNVSRYASDLKAEAGTKLSLDQEDTPFARAVVKVREKGAKASDWVETKAADARSRDDGDTMFGRAVAKVGGVASSMDSKLDDRTKRAVGESRARDGMSTTPTESSAGADDGFVARTMARVETALGTKTMSTRPPEQNS